MRAASVACARHATSEATRFPLVSVLSRSSLSHPRVLTSCARRASLHLSSAAPHLTATCSTSSAAIPTRRLFTSSTAASEIAAQTAATSGGSADDVLLDDEDEAWVESRLEAALYTSSEVAAHSVVDVDKYFLLSAEQQQSIPSQLRPPMDEELRLTGGYMQLHAAYIPLIERMARVYDGSRGRAALIKPIGLHGSHGVGKSATLAYLSLWARERGWLVVAVRADELSMEKMGWIVASSDRPDLFEQPLYTQHWLTQLASSQPNLLSNIAVKGHYLFAAAANCHSLLDLLHIARDDATLATSVLYALVAELRIATEVPVLVLTDNVNVWDGLSQFVDPNSPTARPLPARRLALVDALSTFQHVAPHFGASVFATTAHATKANLHSHFNTRKVRPVLLQPYSHRALQHALVHYHVSGVLVAEVDAQLVGKVKMLSGATPKDVKQAALAM